MTPHFRHARGETVIPSGVSRGFAFLAVFAGPPAGEAGARRSEESAVAFRANEVTRL